MSRWHARALAFSRRQVYAKRHVPTGQASRVFRWRSRAGASLRTPGGGRFIALGDQVRVAQSSEFFPTMGAALRAGKQALAKLFEKHHHSWNDHKVTSENKTPLDAGQVLSVLPTLCRSILSLTSDADVAHCWNGCPVWWASHFSGYRKRRRREPQ